MRVCIAYVAVSQGPIVDQYAARFITTWKEYPPGYDHDTIILCNGGPLRHEVALMFAAMNAKMFPRQNDGGWDISAYQDAARGPCADYDALLCLGESNYFHREGWLGRFVDTWEKYGPGFYGPYSSNAIRAHLNTTAFFCSPTLLKQYPLRAVDRGTRYEFEWGLGSMWRRANLRGLPTRLVTWDGDWEPRMWRMPRNILWRGDQSNLLMWCNHSDGYANADARTKAEWARRSDGAFR